MLSPRRDPSPAPRLDVYDRPGGVHRQPLPKLMHPARRLFRFRDAIVLTRGVILDRRGRNVLPFIYYRGPRDRFPGLARYRDDFWLPDPVGRRSSIAVDEPVFVSQAAHPPYGHVLLETVARLIYLDRCPPDIRVLTSVKMTEAYWLMFEAMGVARERVITISGPAYCRDAYVADTPVDVYGGIVVDAWRAFERLGSLATLAKGPLFERIYISRRRFKNRPLLNEDQLEELFARYGFAIIYPEELPIEEQVGLFAHAKMIAGPRGSGMHHVVFSSPDTRVLLITPRNMILKMDTYLTRRDGTTAHVLGEVSDDTSASRFANSWTIDPTLVEQAIKAHFRL